MVQKEVKGGLLGSLTLHHASGTRFHSTSLLSTLGSVRQPGLVSWVPGRAGRLGEVLVVAKGLKMVLGGDDRSRRLKAVGNLILAGFEDDELHCHHLSTSEILDHNCMRGTR